MWRADPVPVVEKVGCEEGNEDIISRGFLKEESLEQELSPLLDWY